jgi:hypothetical protein
VKRRIALTDLRITQDAEQVNIVLARRGPSFAGGRVWFHHPETTFAGGARGV